MFQTIKGVPKSNCPSRSRQGHYQGPVSMGWCGRRLRAGSNELELLDFRVPSGNESRNHEPGHEVSHEKYLYVVGH